MCHGLLRKDFKIYKCSLCHDSAPQLGLLFYCDSLQDIFLQPRNLFIRELSQVSSATLPFASRFPSDFFEASDERCASIMSFSTRISIATRYAFVNRKLAFVQTRGSNGVLRPKFRIKICAFHLHYLL